MKRVITANFSAYSKYVTDSLHQWDLNQVLQVYGLNLTAAPEVHFSNANTDRAIVRQATMTNHVISVDVPNSLLQDPLRIYAHIGIYEGKTFKVVELVEIPVIARKRPLDYQIDAGDDEVYSFKALENKLQNAATKDQVANIVASVTTESELIDVRYGADGKTYASAGEAVRSQLNDRIAAKGYATVATCADLNTLPANTVYSVTDWTDIANLPDSKVGTCLTISSDANGTRGLQFYAINTGAVYCRTFWTSSSGAKTWNAWLEWMTDEALVGNYLRGTGYATGATCADLNTLPANTTCSITDWTGIANLPEASVGTCLTISSDANGARGLQLYAVSTGRLYFRTFWTSSSGAKTWNAWTNTDPREGTLPELLVGPDQYAVVGKELNLYFCQLFDCVDWRAENITPRYTYSGAGARCYDDRISIIPASAGDFTLTVWADRNITGKKLQSTAAKITVHVSENAAPAEAKKVLFIGDSRTDLARLCPKDDDLADAITLLGTRETGGLKHEGYSGWTAEAFCTMAGYKDSTNPFYNPNTGAFDFAYYMAAQGYTGVDYVNIMLGVNDGYTEAAAAYIEQMVDSIHAYNAGIIVTVMLEYVPPFSAYYTGQLHMTSSAQCFYHHLVEAFGDRTKENIFLLPTNTALDDYFDWSKTTVPVCQASAETVEVIADNVHPKTIGFNKLAAIWVAFFRNTAN